MTEVAAKEETLVRRRGQMFMAAWAAGFLAFVGIAAALLLLTLTAIDTNRLARSTGELAESNKATGDRLLDCTTPGGQCYQELRSPENSEAVAALMDTIVAAAVCAHRPENTTADLVRACVEAEGDR